MAAGCEAIHLDGGASRATILTLGARLAEWRLADGTEIVDPVDETAARGRKKFHGAIVGPVANRIAGATAPIAGVAHRFAANEGPNTLHSGPEGAHRAVWSVTGRTPRSCVLELRQPEGHGGFGAARRLSASYTLAGATLRLVIEAEAEGATLLNPAFHPYFRAGEGARLRVRATRYLPVDAAKLPTGEIAPALGEFDLSRPSRPSAGIDHAYLLDPGAGPAAVLDTGAFRLELETDAPALQVFAGKPGLIALEPEIHPDAANHAGFPSIEMRAGQRLRQESLWRVIPAGAA